MPESTSYCDVIENSAGPPPATGILFPELSKKFLVRKPPFAFSPTDTNKVMPLSVQGHEQVSHEDLLVRLPSLAESKWKVRVLQGWVGVVERVTPDRFFAIVTDVTNPRNPPEQVELDLSEISESDLSLLAEGAKFYWSIGYRDTPGGQRERISTLRFARQAPVDEAEVERIFEEADRLAAFLES
jgi:hypothetical protein